MNTEESFVYGENKSGRLVISIVSHNQNALVDELLTSMDLHCRFEQSDPLVVVTQNTNEDVALRYVGRFRVVTKHNLNRRGFGENHNHVFENYECDYFAILNPDLVFTHSVNLDGICSVMQRKLGVYSPIVKEENGNIADFRRKDLTLKNLVMRYLFNLDEESDFDWIAGMSLFIPAKVFSLIGGFDERFFMYVEDCDLCKRVGDQGFELRTFDDFEVLHIAQRASRRSCASFLVHVSSLMKYWIKNIRGY